MRIRTLATLVLAASTVTVAAIPLGPSLAGAGEAPPPIDPEELEENEGTCTPEASADGTSLQRNCEPTAVSTFVQTAGETLPDPQISATPAVGEPAVVGFPTFVTVDNWTGATLTTTNEGAGGVEITLFATPVLMGWDPGDGTDWESCTGPGRPYDPNGAVPEVQAADPAACSHTYTKATGRDGRPAAWPGVVHVYWQVTSSSASPGGPPATIQTISSPATITAQTTVSAAWEPSTSAAPTSTTPQYVVSTTNCWHTSADLPRAVTEVPTVITGGDT